MIILTEHAIRVQGHLAHYPICQHAVLLIQNAHLRIRQRSARGKHLQAGPVGSGGTGHTLDLHGLAVDLIHRHRALQSALGDGENVLGHGVTGTQRRRVQAIGREALGKSVLALIAHRFGTVRDRAPAGKIHPHQIALTNFLRAEIVGKIGQPTQSTMIAGDRLQQFIGRAHPLERRKQYQRHAQ